MTSRPKARIGLALAGGGAEGAIYEIGALRALEEAVAGLDFTRLDVYVGVSAGAFVAACLANRIPVSRLCRGLVSPEPGMHPIAPRILFTPAWREWVRSGGRLPRLAAEAVADLARHPGDVSLLGALTRLARALPVGLFDNEPFRAYLERTFNRPGRTDDFRRLSSKLVVVAADLDSGSAVRFGEPPFDTVPISRAVQASTALPGLYPPAEIDGRCYVDGVLLKTLHASVALEAKVDLLIGVNPIVPVDTARAVERGVMRRGRLTDRGLPTVLSQTLRTLIHSRMTTGFAKYAALYPSTDVLLLEPRRDDYRMFFTNVFSLSARRATAEHAYEATRRTLRERADEIAPRLAKLGLELRRDVLNDPDRDLWSGVGIHEEARSGVARKLHHLLDRLDAVLESAD
ncbi:MAG: patatin family protein [Acidobacteria bacterium]|nr:MAG: patatin family protein [Acidobacteriota bacterium]